MLRVPIHQPISFTLPPISLFVPWGFLCLANEAGLLPTNGRRILKPLHTTTVTAPTGVLMYNQNDKEAVCIHTF